MPRENTVPSFDRPRVRTGGLHLASANSKVTKMSTLSTTNLRVVSRNPDFKAQPSPTPSISKPIFAEHQHRSRKALIRMALAAAAAPVLWLVHALALQLHHAF